MGNTENRTTGVPQSATTTTPTTSEHQQEEEDQQQQQEDQKQENQEQQQDQQKQENQDQKEQENQEQQQREENQQNQDQQQQQQQQENQEQQQEENQQEEKEKPEPNNNNKANDDLDIHDVVPVLRCGSCRYPLCLVKDILTHRANDVWMAHVYAYELDLFTDAPPLWCYSATNPAARRFDLIRCHSSHAMRLRGPWSREHSFFVEHEWCYCSCRNCNNFIGWGFRPVESDSDYSDSDYSNSNSDNNNNSGASSYTSIREEEEDGRSETVEEEKEKEDDKEEEEEEEVEELEEEETEEEEEEEEEEEKKGDKHDLTIEPESVLFVGLILTHCVGDEKYPRQIYETLQNMSKTFRTMEALGVC